MAASTRPWASAALETSPRTATALPPAAGDGGDDSIRTSLAGCVVDDDGGSFSGERFGDGCSYALGCAGDDCNFACELAHIVIPFQ